MSKRERLEITFGAKDADIWEYIEQTGLPKASVAKKLMRAGIELEKGNMVVNKVIVEEVVEKKEEPVKLKSAFGSSVKVR